MKKTFYTYILVNSLDNQPFYVGKGSGTRMYQHLREATRSTFTKRSVHCKILSILSQKGKIKYEKFVAKNEQAAFDKEKDFIATYGRKDIGTGILCNLSDGGEGSTNINPESVKRRAEKHRGMKRSEKAKQNMKEAQLRIIAERVAKTGNKVSDASRKKMSKSRKGKPWSENARAAERHKPTAISVIAHNKKTNDFVGKWNSISECAKELNCEASSIWKILNGWTSKAPDGTVRPFRSHRGYIFKRAD
jgi:hypothetical protein